jgi:hypothetical protein
VNQKKENPMVNIEEYAETKIESNYSSLFSIYFHGIESISSYYTFLNRFADPYL